MTRIKRVPEPPSEPEFAENTPAEGDGLQFLIKTRATFSLLQKLRRDQTTSLVEYNRAVESINFVLKELDLLDLSLKAGFPATPLNPNVTNITATSATLNWTRPSETYIENYLVYRRPIAGTAFELVATLGLTSSYEFTGLDSDAEYRFGVTGAAADGTLGLRADTNIVRTLAVGGAGPANSQTLQLHGAGTHNAAVPAPNGSRVAAFADVGGTRSIGAGDTQWSYHPTGGNNASRQVAGGCITNGGIIYQLVGTALNSGILQRINTTTGLVDELRTNLDVFANQTTIGDSGARPRPVGYMVLYDETSDLVYGATEEGVIRYNAGTSTYDGVIALAGESCRALAHVEHGIIYNEQNVLVATRTKGLVRLTGIQGAPTVYRVSPPQFGRVEDVAYIDRAEGSALAACHTDGVYRYDGTGNLQLNDQRVTCGSNTPSNVSNTRYGFEFEGLMDWSTATGELISAWGGTNGTQTIRLTIDAGVLQYRMRHSTTQLFALTANAAFTEGFGRLAVRVRPLNSSDVVLEKRGLGEAWQQIGIGSQGTNFPSGSPVPLTIGETAGGANRLPLGARLIRASMTALNATEPVRSIDVSGALAGASTAVGINGDSWSWPAAVGVIAGGASVKPTQASGTGANGNATRWTAVGTTRVGTAVYAALGMVNSDGFGEWVYRTLDAATVGPGGWQPGTPSRAVMQLGSAHNSPANRIYGDSATGNDNSLVGTFTLAFDPDDDTGNTLISAATLSLYISRNFAGPQADITWESHNAGLSMLSVADANFDSEGHLTITCADHNSFTFDASELLTHEPHHASVSDIRDAWSTTSVGTGANKVTVLMVTNDQSPTDSFHDIVYRRGTGPVQSWVTTGFNASLNGAGSLSAGQRPRPGGGHLWDRGDGNLALVAWADGLGFVRSVYTFATDAWANYQQQASGPTTNLTTSNQLQERQVVGAADGSVLFGLQLSNTQLWRSTDGGVNWTPIASSAFGFQNGSRISQDQRTGRIEYIEGLDVLIASDATGLFRIDNPRTSADVTRITGINTACMIAHYGTDVYVHVRGNGPCDLFRFTNILSATSTDDATQIAEPRYRYRVGDLACTMTAGTSGGVPYLVTGYQGSGLEILTLPA